MYTQCPECKTRRKISVNQLKKSRAIVLCKNCSVKFDALELLTESLPETQLPKDKPSESSSKKRRSSKGKSSKRPSRKTGSATKSISPLLELLTETLSENQHPKDKPSESSSKKRRSSKGKSSKRPSRKTGSATKNTTPIIKTAKNVSIDSSTELLPWETQPTAKSTFHWNLGFYAVCLLLIGQIYYFEGYSLSQNARLRPWLTKACYLINCSLPVYKNLTELSVINGTLQAASGNTLNFQAAFTNDADFPQAYPDLKLTLLRFNGDPFAERIFKPLDYSPDRPYYKKISAGELVEINFSIAIPEDKIGGYTFKLI